MAVESTTTENTGEQAQGYNPSIEKLAGLAAALGGDNPVKEYIKNAAPAEPVNSGNQQQNIRIDSGEKIQLFPEGGDETKANGEDPLGASKNQGQSNENPSDKDENDNEEDSSLEHSLFGGKLTFGKETKSEGEGDESLKVDLNTVDGLTSLFKEKLGVESADKIPEKIESLVASATKVNELEVQMNNVTAMFNEMDPQLYQAVVAWRNGENWKALVSNSSIDYTKDVKSFEPKSLINAMLPEVKISEAEWEEYGQEDGDPKVKALIDLALSSAKEKFISKSESIKEASERIVTENLQKSQRYEASVKISQDYLSAKYPNVDKTYLVGVAEEFKTGKAWSVFANEDGTLREDAMLRYAMAKDGENLLNQALKKIENAKTTIVNQGILDHVANIPSGQTGGSGSKGQAEIRQEVQEKLNFINGSKAKRSHF